MYTTKVNNAECSICGEHIAECDQMYQVDTKYALCAKCQLVDENNNPVEYSESEIKYERAVCIQRRENTAIERRQTFKVIQGGKQ